MRHLNPPESFGIFMVVEDNGWILVDRFPRFARWEEAFLWLDQYKAENPTVAPFATLFVDRIETRVAF